MRFAVTLGRGNLYKQNLQLMKQLGCTDVIGRGPASDVWKCGDLAQLKRRVENRGLRLDIFEDAPNHHKIIYNLPGREEQVENFYARAMCLASCETYTQLTLTIIQNDPR